MTGDFVNNENKTELIHKELDLIQDVIKRMANNSFMVKGWCTTLFVGLVAFFRFSKLSDLILGISIIVIVCSFCYLDAFFLWTERKYRRLYKDVIEKRVSGDFSNLYSLNCKPYEKESIFDVILNREYSKNSANEKKRA